MASFIFSVLVAVCILGILSETEAVDPPCPCPRIYNPVCGKDGNDYPSPCDMKCSGVEEAYKGRCEDRGSRGSHFSQGEGDSDGNDGPTTVSGVEEAYKGRCEERGFRGSQFSQGEGDSEGNGGPTTVSCGFYVLTVVALVRVLHFGY